ncbi:MAG: endolytic transglycosylase MltG [Candidatus Saccharibacteria bacterium]|nr:endolytic transglycosylase MltG [Candidatus Saccharibacteria bacterium]
MRIIGLDVGEKRIGVAKVDSDTKIAVPVGFINVDGSEWEEIRRIISLNNTSLFVLGLPRSNEGNETAQTQYVRNFARVLLEKIPEAKIRFQDESLTSVEAEARLKRRKKKYEKGDIDAEAATIILQDFVENFREPEVGPQVSPTRLEREGEKVALKTKIAKTKLKKLLIFPPIVLIAICLLVAGILIRNKQLREREEYFAKLEAEMEPEVFNFTILPGETIFSVKKRLNELGYSQEEIESAFNFNFDLDFLKERPEGASLEGYLYGETHEFYKTATVREILERFLADTGRVIEENNLRTAYKEQGLSLYEGITLASIVQKEAPPSEMATVAQVFLSRLRLGWKLGSDVTVAYALDLVDPERNIYKDNQAALMIDSPYNTRLYPGLPFGPICNPGLSALIAVAHPSDSAYLFFLTGDDGSMYYSYTEAEHNRNAALYCQTLCNISL